MAITIGKKKKRKRKKKKTHHHHHQSPISSEADSQPLPNIPHEIIAEILSRLPVKSLLQFRSVCKSWLSLISDPQFVKTHLNIVSKTDDCTRHGLVWSCLGPDVNVMSCPLYSVLDGQPDGAVELDYPLEHTRRAVRIVGSCNGLVCVGSGEDDLFLWNPSTRKSKRLPNAGDRMWCELCVDYGDSICGFGYDDFDDDYKVVATFCVDGGGTSVVVKVYTLRSNSWRRIGDFPSRVLSRFGKMVNGSLHWAARRNTSCDLFIASFDLSKETYGEVLQPDYGEVLPPDYGDGGFELSLCVSQGCLCVLGHFPGIRGDVWIMKEYGKRESWAKLFSISYVTYPDLYEKPTPLCISKNGEILLELEGQLVLYNPKDGTFRNHAVCNLWIRLGIDIYVGSLVSPIAGNVAQRQHQ